MSETLVTSGYAVGNVLSSVALVLLTRRQPLMASFHSVHECDLAGLAASLAGAAVEAGCPALPSPELLSAETKKLGSADGYRCCLSCL